MSQSAIQLGANLRGGWSFEAELWEPENKEQSQFREPRDTLPQCLGGRQSQQAVMDKGSFRYRFAEKFRQGQVCAVYVWGVLTSGQAFCGKA
jgi:hypothetical protein